MSTGSLFQSRSPVYFQIVNRVNIRFIELIEYTRE